MQRKYVFLITVIAVISLIGLFIFMDIVEHPYADIGYKSIGEIVEVSFPIDSDDEAISYALSVEDFTEFRENATTSAKIEGEWKVRVRHITPEFPLTKGEYWNLAWKKGDMLCGILFRSNGTILGVTEFFSGVPGMEYRCFMLRFR